jgi:hypothetical protein
MTPLALLRYVRAKIKVFRQRTKKVKVEVIDSACFAALRPDKA